MNDILKLLKHNIMATTLIDIALHAVHHLPHIIEIMFKIRFNLTNKCKQSLLSNYVIKSSPFIYI